MTTYRVRRGDSLWTISREHLGGGSEWPRLWRYNNRRDVIGQTGRGIPNPDLIYPDQRLLLPILPGTKPAPTPAGSSSASGTAPRPGSGAAQPLRHAQPDQGPGSLADRLPHVQSPMSIKYKLDDIKFPPVVQPGATLEMKMTGDVVLMSRKAVPALYVTNRREIELQVVSQANHAFGQLVSDNRLVYDDASRKLTLRSMLVLQSTMPGAPSTAVGIEMNSQSPVPKLRFEIRLPKLEGNIRDFLYVAYGVVIVVELTPHPQPPSGPQAQPLRVPQTVPSPGVNWQKVLGTGLVITAGVIVVGTLVEDFFTVGAGVADDPASFAGAGAAFARGMAMMRSGAVVLPRAAVPASIVITATVVPDHLPAAHR